MNIHMNFKIHFFQLCSCLLCVSFLWSFFCVLLVPTHRECWFYIEDHKKKAKSNLFSMNIHTQLLQKSPTGKQKQWGMTTHRETHRALMPSLLKFKLWNVHGSTVKGSWQRRDCQRTLNKGIKKTVICLFMDMSLKKKNGKNKKRKNW